VEIWDAVKGRRLIGDLRHPQGAIDRILFLNGGRSFLTVAGNNSPYTPFEIRQWATADGAPLSSPVMEPRLNLAVTGVSPDGQVIAVADSYQLRLGDVDTGLELSAAMPLESREDYPRESSRFPNSESVFSADGRRLYIETKESLWMLPLGQIVDSLPSDERLKAWAELLSGHRIDAAGAYVPLNADDHEKAWLKLSE
jgi:hypothetical protein